MCHQLGEWYWLYLCVGSFPLDGADTGSSFGMQGIHFSHIFREVSAEDDAMSRPGLLVVEGFLFFELLMALLWLNRGLFVPSLLRLRVP